MPLSAVLTGQSRLLWTILKRKLGKIAARSTCTKSMKFDTGTKHLKVTKEELQSVVEKLATLPRPCVKSSQFHNGRRP